jgi:hypothetical protein
MHVLKFILGGEPPETIYCDETIGFNETLTVSGSSLTLYETIGFRDVIPGGINELLYETIGFSDEDLMLTYDIEIYDTIGFQDGGDETLVVYCSEIIGFNDSIEQELSNNIFCVETIGFGDSGYQYLYNEHDITFTWRTRTNADPTYGHGGAEYGGVVSYGDGDAANLVAFEIHIWKLGGPDTNRWLNSDPAEEFDDRLTKQVITIADTGDPDADASYTLTIANNISFSGGVFTAELEAEIFVKDDNGVYSFPKIIVTDSFKVYHEE